MGRVKFCNILISHFITSVAIKPVSMFDRSFFIYVFTIVIKIIRFITRYLYRLKPGHVSEEKGLNNSSIGNDDGVVCKDCMVFLSSGIVEKESLELIKKIKDCDRIKGDDAEDSVFLQSGLIPPNNSSNKKYQYTSRKDVIEFVEETNTANLIVQEMFVGSDDDDQSLGSEISQGLLEFDEKSDDDDDRSFGSGISISRGLLDFDEKSDSPSDFVFKFSLGSCYSTNEHTQQEHVLESKNINPDEGEETMKIACAEVSQENEHSNSADSKDCKVDGLDSANNETMEEDRDFELLPRMRMRYFSSHVNQEESVVNTENERSCTEGIDFLESNDHHNKKAAVFVEERDIDRTRLFTRSPVSRIEAIEEEETDLLEATDQKKPGLTVEQHDADQTRFSKSSSSTVLRMEDIDEGIDIIEAAADQKTTGVFVEERSIDQKRFFISSPVLRIEDVEYLDDEFLEFEPLTLRVNSTDTTFEESFSNGDVGKTDESTKDESLHTERMASTDGSQENKTFWDSDSDDEDEPDALSDHQNLVQQMKMELKHCRNGGLPTISEECESFKVVEDLKPLNIDPKFEYKDVMDEIQKFYKSYADKMRKLDILNYQTLQAISFLQLKDSEVFTAGKKKSASTPFDLPKILSYKAQRIYADSTRKSITEMNHDLDLVYVGQLCLSWEILCWLYVKARELMEYDCKGNHSYNRVSEEFQQFQVLLQRFVEDERFQGPRIQNYVRSRCTIRSLLQVPAIRDDLLKDKKERRDGTDAISLESLAEIIRESMMIIKEFVHADKSAANVILKGIQGTQVDRRDTANSELLLDIVTNLQKKDRRIKEQMRSKNCIVRKFQKHQEEHHRLDDELLISQVELSLVSRVLSLSRLTRDQLLWCQNKLGNISFVKRRVRVEPSFLLFPC